MRTRARNPFSTVSTAGLLLPVDLLTRVVDGDSKLPGLSPKDYHLRNGERVNEAASRAWNECLAAWTSFRKKLDALPASDAGTSLTRDEWLLPLFQELGYGRLQTKKAIEIDSREYPVSHGWENHVPIHLLSARLPLDRRSPGVSGAATRAPYSLVQELVNRSGQHRWGMVSNGLKLFVLRDNAALARAANVEFDLEAMMEGEVYADFMLLFLLCHQSRLEIPPDGKPEDCWLEKWANQADQQGTRAREKLRDGVEAAIKSLGAGFLTTKGNRNHELRDRLRSGELSTQNYYHQLLRVVYRLLMLLVAEEKKSESGDNLFHPPDTPAEVRERYARYYSVGRIRTLAYERRGTAHTDLYESLKVLFVKLREGYQPLGIPGFGSFLFSDQATPDLDDAVLANQDLLDAFRHLCYTDDASGRGGAVRRPVDFGNLGSEELGSVYESLLELHPRIDADEGPFTLATAAGHERKTTGSYYTPRSLINCLLDSALDPVVAEAIDVPDSAEAQKKLLDLKVCDPACGSGHFLIAAADRMATHLARLRTGDDQPSTLNIQRAKRHIIGRCIYGVDVNKMAVELCKVSLWMEALEPGKPLSFLDHHIQCGNSLLGTTPQLLAEGIPDAAFKAIEGDDKKICAELRKDNKQERKDYAAGYRDFHVPFMLGNLPAEFARLACAADESVDDVASKRQRYERLVGDAAYQNAHLLADAWCAAFVWKKDKSDLGKLCPTERGFRNLEATPNSILPHVKSEVQRLADQYKFFHWHLAFPDVFRLPESGDCLQNTEAGWNGGFDIVLGNPPWVRQEVLGDTKQLLSMMPSFTSTADLSVFFIDLALRVLQRDRPLAFLTPNKWFKTKYGSALRSYVRQIATIDLLVDFGHSRILFPDADTFPAAVVLRPANQPVSLSDTFKLVEAPDSLRESVSLRVLVESHGIDVAYSQLSDDGWRLESRAVNDVFEKMKVHRSLGDILPSPIRRGVTTGFNTAFVIDAQQRTSLISAEPQAADIIHPWMRGADIKRWRHVPSDQYLIFTRRGINIAKYPEVKRYLATFRDALTPKTSSKEKGPGRKPGPYKWFEIQDNTAYYRDFEAAKIVVPSILYYSEFAFVPRSAYPSNKVNVIPSDDLGLLALLNSNTMWWFINRHFIKMKDDALSVDVEALLKLPIPQGDPTAWSSLAELAQEMLQRERTPERILEVELAIDEIVAHMFDLTANERATINATSPARSPVAVASSKMDSGVSHRAPRQSTTS